MDEHHTPGEAGSIFSKLKDAMNRHDLSAFLACFDDDYQSEQPLHPDRQFGGRDQVEKNWSSIFAAMPDFHAELLRSAEEDGVSWAEWHWTGTRADGNPMDMRGVTIFGLQEGRFIWGRLYMEHVEQHGAGIDSAVQSSIGKSQSSGPEAAPRRS